jgi:hypothetical protein
MLTEAGVSVLKKGLNFAVTDSLFNLDVVHELSLWVVSFLLWLVWNRQNL